MRLLPRGMASRLFLAFFATAMPLLVAAGLLLEWQASRALDAELARRVESLAVAVSASIPPDSWRMLFSLGPGEEESRTARHLRALLTAVRDGTGSEDIAVWTPDGRVVLECGPALKIGSPAPRAAYLRDELEAAGGGRAASQRVFTSASGRPIKIGLAPIPGDAPHEVPRGVVVVEAPSRTVAVVAAMRRTLLTMGVIALAAVAGAALLISRTATQRIRELVAAAQRIGRGDLESPVPPLGGDEIGVLGGALEGMREGVRVRDAQLRAMVGGVAHEIRNPLGGLMLFAEMLARDPALTSEQAQRARRILDETGRLERVVGEFLAFARPEQPRREAVGLQETAREVVEGLRAARRWEGGVEIGGVSATVACDPGHLRQILINLIQNAMQAAPGAGGRIAVNVVREAAGVALTLEDSGPGIAPADRERVFEPFFTTRAAGAGLGLAIVKRLCDLNRIEIAVGEGTLGGACFRLQWRAGSGG